MFYGKRKETSTQNTNEKQSIIYQLLEESDIESAQDIQNALKNILYGTIKEMMEAEGMTIWAIPSLNAPTVMITVTTIVITRTILTF